MVREVVNSVPMDAAFVTEWFESTMSDFAGRNKSGMGYIQIIWRNVSPNPNASIRIEVTNDLQFTSVTGVHQVNSIDNSANALMIAVYPGFRFIRFIYSPNFVTQGQLTVNINYE
jgi:hypothetical protein